MTEHKPLKETEPRRLQASLLFNKKEPQIVLNEVKTTTLMMFPEFDFRRVSGVFEDVVRLFKGQYPGYRECNTQYHDLEHTTDTLLAMVRLIHGAMINEVSFSEKNVGLGLISALFHDTGYIQSIDDDVGTGAKFTASHIKRSTAFMEEYLLQRAYPGEDVEFCKEILKCTGLNVNMNASQFINVENEMLGKILGTADLLGQMSDRTYLEKLPFLYHEFKEGKVGGYKSELDLIEKTPEFVKMTMGRFEDELSGVYKYMRDHFRVRWGIDEDLYMIALEETLQYLNFILENHRNNYREYLRRSGLVERLKERLRKLKISSA
jgi:hypothetical protein